MAQTRAGRPQLAARRLNDALTVLDLADGRARDPEVVALRVNTLVSLSLPEFLLRGKSTALSRLARAEAEVWQAADLVDVGALLARIAYQRANIHGRTGDLGRAAEEFEHVTRRLDAFTDQERCTVQLGRGMVALGQARPDRAADAFADAGRLAHELGAVEQEFMALHNGGYAAYLLGDLPRALAEMSRAEQVPARVSRATARLDRGTVLLDAGLVSDAVEVFRAGAAECRTRGQSQVCADHHLELARALLVLGRHDAALAEVRRARAGYRRIGAEGWDARATLLGLRTMLEQVEGDQALSPGWRRRRALGAAQQAEALVDVALQLGDKELVHRAHTVAAAGLALAGEIAAASDQIRRAGKHHHDSLAEELHRVAVEVSVLARSGDVRSARRILSRSARTLAAAQCGSASIDMRTARAALGVRLGALDLDLARGRGSAAVLESLERWRSATDRLPLVRRPPDTELAELTERLRAVRARMRDETDSRELAELQRRSSRLERQIRARDWTLSHRGDLTTALPLRVREARDVLAATGRDLVWFFPHRGRLCGLGLVRGRASVKELMALEDATELSRRMRADLRVAATKRLGPLEDAVWGSLRATAARLDEALLAPWRLAGAGVVLVPSPELSALPWSLLPRLAGDPVTVAWSLTAFARRSSTERLLSHAPPAVHVAVGPDVARGRSEATAIAGLWGDRAAVQAPTPSTSRHLVDALAAPGIVHVAAHGTHEPESPLFSSVALDDGPLFAHELQPTGVAADHVVLSACEVGVATTRPGDEALGLAASMLTLGARSVVAAVAPVPDDVAAETMVRHHRALASGMASDEALASAIASTEPVAAAFLSLGGRWDVEARHQR